MDCDVDCEWSIVNAEVDSIDEDVMTTGVTRSGLVRKILRVCFGGFLGGIEQICQVWLDGMAV